MTASKYPMIHFVNGLLIFRAVLMRSIGGLSEEEISVCGVCYSQCQRLRMSLAWSLLFCSDIREELYKWFAFRGTIHQRDFVNVADWEPPV